MFVEALLRELGYCMGLRVEKKLLRQTKTHTSIAIRLIG